MKILDFTYNKAHDRMGYKCFLEVEIEGEKTVLGFHGEDIYYYANTQTQLNYYQQTTAATGTTLGSLQNVQPTVKHTDEEIKSNLMEQAKRELSSYLSGKLWKEYDSMKALKK